MALRRYVASGKAETNAVLLSVAATVAVALGAGLVEGLVSLWFSLFILFPILLGAVVGGVGSVVVKRQKLRAPVVALLVGALAGSAAYATTHGISYAAFRREVAATVREESPGATEEQVGRAVDDAIVQASGRAGFAGFMLLAAEQGITVTSHGSKNTFNGVGAWVVWALEWLCAAALAGGLMLVAANEPFCEGCEEWFGGEHHLRAGGDGKRKQERQALLAALDAGDDAAVAQALASVNPKNHFALTARSCGKCGLEVFFTLKRVVIASNKTNVTKVKSWLVGREQAARFQQAIAPPPGPSAGA